MFRDPSPKVIPGRATDVIRAVGASEHVNKGSHRFLSLFEARRVTPSVSE
jgi:hypothetical protein